MKREVLYERHEKAGKMEANMILVAGIAVIAAIIAFVGHGWIPSVGFLIMGALAFALSRVFDLLGDLFASIHNSDERPALASVKEKLSET